MMESENKPKGMVGRKMVFFYVPREHVNSKVLSVAKLLVKRKLDFGDLLNRVPEIKEIEKVSIFHDNEQESKRSNSRSALAHLMQFRSNRH